MGSRRTPGAERRGEQDHPRPDQGQPGSPTKLRSRWPRAYFGTARPPRSGPCGMLSIGWRSSAARGSLAQQDGVQGDEDGASGGGGVGDQGDPGDTGGGLSVPGSASGVPGRREAVHPRSHLKSGVAATLVAPELLVHLPRSHLKSGVAATRRLRRGGRPRPRSHLKSGVAATDASLVD